MVKQDSKVDSQLKFEIEQALAALRHEYERLEEPSRRRVREWISRLEEVASQGGTALPLFSKVFVQLPIQSFHEPAECMEARLPVRVLKHAIEAWQRGEDYLSTSKDYYY
jgi:hypothetical protein